MLNWPVTLSDRSASGKSIIQLIAAGERACRVRIWELSHVLRCFPSSLLFLESNSQSGFPGGASGKEPTCQCRRHKRCRFHPWVGRSPGRGHGNPLQYSCLEDPMDRGPRQTDWRNFREGPLARRLLIFAWGRGPSLIWGVTKKGWGIHIDLDWKLLGFQFSNVNILPFAWIYSFYLHFAPSPFLNHFATRIHKFCFLLCNTWLFNWFSLTRTCIVSLPIFFFRLSSSMHQISWCK